ncbi:MAG TPA: glycoside hydrolase family 3 N-terminal domain-containing protein [Elainellaceae cyanobacterium]
MASLLPDWRELSLAEQVAQMVVVRASGHLFDDQIQYPDWEPANATLMRWLRDLKVGGVILLGGSAAELAARSHQLQSWAALPLLVAADIEEGVGQRFSGATWFPPPMAIAEWARRDLDQAILYAEKMGAITAQEALAIGLNWILAPVVDVNNNPLNPVINVRAFGDTPSIVSQLATAFIRGTQPYPVLTSAKHFPGHGDTAVDSHLDLPVLPHDSARLAEIELPPFKAAIATGVDSVMSAHLHIPALDSTYPATLSHPVLTRVLRQELGFEGLIVTDALVMGAIANHYGANDAPVMAVEAGADILLMPLDPEGAIHAVCRAVESGRIASERIHASIERIWAAKQNLYGKYGEQYPSPPREAPSPTTSRNEVMHWEHLAQPHATDAAAQILRHSMQVDVDQPLASVESGRNVIIVDDVLDCDFLGHHTPAIALPKHYGYHHLQLIDRHTPRLPSHHYSDSDTSVPTLLQLFVRGNPFRGSAGLTHTANDWLTFLVETQQLSGLVIYGSPYVLEHLRPSVPSQIPWVFTYGQISQAQRIALSVMV